VSEHEQEFDDKDFEEAAAEDDGLPDDGEVAKTPIKLTPEILKRDRREFDWVEMNISTGDAVIVKKSDAPKLTKKVLKEKGAPIQTAEIVFDGELLEVDYWHGIPLGLEIERAQLLDAYKDREMTPELMRERENTAKHLILSRMINDPVFSLAGDPADGYPIEDCSPILLDALWQGCMAVNAPVEDNIFKVKVLRGVPLETHILLGQAFESFPVGKGLELTEMNDEEIETRIERLDAERAVYVATMVLDPPLSLNGEGNGKHPYPTEQLSEKMMACLYSAYRTVNVPAAGVQALNRFRRRRKN